jgi:hypothetical protein
MGLQREILDTLSIVHSRQRKTDTWSVDERNEIKKKGDSFGFFGLFVTTHPNTIPIHYSRQIFIIGEGEGLRKDEKRWPDPKTSFHNIKRHHLAFLKL